MKAYLISLLILISLEGFNQQHCFKKIDFEYFINHHISDTTELWNELKKSLDYPIQAINSQSMEKVEIHLIYNPIDSTESRFLYTLGNSFFKKEIENIEGIVISNLRKSENPYIVKFFIHFTLEWFNYPNGVEYYTYGGLFYDKENLVIRGWLPPIIKRGG